MINGVVAKNVLNTNPNSFGNVKVFAGDNFEPAPTSAMYKNLIWESRGKLTAI